MKNSIVASAEGFTGTLPDFSSLTLPYPILAILAEWGAAKVQHACLSLAQ